jgi:carbamate kinase
MRTIEALLASGVTVIASGAIPVTELPSGGFQGAEALPDKDAYASLLARSLAADALILLTDVLSVATDFGKPGQQQIRRATPNHLKSLDFEAHTMRPKVEAASMFVSETGKWAAIGGLSDIGRILAGEAGTRIVPSLPGPIAMWSA